MIVFIENCSLLVDRLGRTSECYIEVEQKRRRGWGGGGRGPPPLATPLHFFCYVLFTTVFIVMLKFVLGC